MHAFSFILSFVPKRGMVINMNIQIKKGVLELCVLAMLEGKDRYGYELVNEISKSIQMADGTIYPLLKRLKDEGYLTTYLVESQEGPPRKYYKITDFGKKTNAKNLEEWNKFTQSVNEFLEEERNHE
jgi:PadR family transcriptional regulator PadR